MKQVLFLVVAVALLAVVPGCKLPWMNKEADHKTAHSAEMAHVAEHPAEHPVAAEHAVETQHKM